MNKLLVALIAGAFASVAAAQTPAPATTPAKEKQADVKATTQAGSGSSASTQKTAAEQAANTAKSKETAKMTTAEKNQMAKDVNKSAVNPNNSSGATATANMQKQTTAESVGLGVKGDDVGHFLAFYHAWFHVFGDWGRLGYRCCMSGAGCRGGVLRKV